MAGRRDLPPDEERCVHIKATGTRCQQPRRHRGRENDTLCTWHEDALTMRARYWRRAEELEDVPIEQHLQMELRMSLIQLQELEFQVLDVGLSTAAWKTETKEVEKRESEDARNSYVSSKRAQLLGAHPVIIHYLREREHHMSVVKTCISAGLAARQLAAIERFVESLVSAQMSLAEALGHDPNNTDTRRVIMETIKKQQMELSDLQPKQLGVGDG